MTDEPMRDRDEDRSEMNDLRGELSDSIGKFFSAPRVKAAFNEASTPLKIAGGALVLGLLWKPALLVAVGAGIYGGIKAAVAYDEYDDNDRGGPSRPNGPRPDDLTF